MSHNRKKFFQLALVSIFTCLSLVTFVFAATGSMNVNLTVTTPGGGGGGGGNNDIYGCTDSSATNFNPSATKNDGSCRYDTVVLGCTDSLALNYNSSANKDDGSCQYPPELKGCTDKAAINYDAEAKQDDGSCIYRETVPNVSNFQSNFNVDNKKIYLTWTKPVFAKFKTVRIVRSTFGIPSNPEDGAVVYEGSAQSAVDPAVEYSVRYYYTAFVENVDHQYSSGAVTNAIGLKDGETEPPIVPPACVGPECGYRCIGDNCDPKPPVGPIDNNPFASLPNSTTSDPILIKLAVSDFVLRQNGEMSKYFGTGSVVKIKGNKNTLIEIDRGSLPTVLKTIGVVISDPKNPKRSFSFIMRDNGSGQYSANIGPFWRNGVFPITIYIINYQDQSVKRITGRLQVAGVSFLQNSALVATAQKYVDPAITALGLGAGLSQAAIIGSNINSIYDVYLLLMRLVYSVLSWLGIRRKKPEWGTVYDAVTKQPIDPAYITVQNVAGEEVTSAITDIDGRFGFLLPKNVYYIKVGKSNYLFPSETLKGKGNDEIYDNLYFGTPLAHDGNQIIKLNIPLDPINFDWNEFAKSKLDFFKIYTKKEKFRRRLVGGIFYAGFALSFVKTLISPSLLDICLLAIYTGVLVYQRFQASSHKIISVKNSSGEPIAFAIVRLFLPGIDQPIKTTTTDRFGHLYALVRPGNYYLTIEEKVADGSYKQIYKSPEIAMPKGVLDKDIVV